MAEFVLEKGHRCRQACELLVERSQALLEALLEALAPCKLLGLRRERLGVGNTRRLGGRLGNCGAAGAEEQRGNEKAGRGART